VYKKRHLLSHISKVMFNTNFLFLCLQAMQTMTKKSSLESYFVPGKKKLAGMSIQLKNMGIKMDKHKILKADGVVCSASYRELKILV
ncbi:hypothetical protein FB192DRAFT_1259979, partial [Mucor lusitanicus]